nr:hypothetical protein [Tanacetum cinerariifolium]
MIDAQVGDLAAHTTKYTSPALTQKVFANMRRVGKGFSGVDTPLFEGMLVPQQAHDDVAVDDVADVVADAEPTSPTPATTPPHQQELILSGSQVKENQEKDKIRSKSDKNGKCVEAGKTKREESPRSTTMTRKVENLEQDKIAQGLEITKLKQRVRRLEKKNKLKASGGCIQTGGIIAKIDVDEDVTLEEVDAEKDADAHGRLKDAARRRKGVVIRDPEETATPLIIVHSEPKSKDKVKGILVEEPKPLKKQTQIEQDEAYTRKLEADLNANINSDDVIEQLEEEASKALKRKSKSSEQQAAKKQKLDEEVEELKIHLYIVPNNEDDVYTEATPLALKVPVVDYQIHNENNKPYYKVIRTDRTHQLFLSFISLLRNFYREDLEMLWQIVQERFASSKPKNFSDDFLLNTLKSRFGLDVVEDFKEYTLRDYYCWLKTYCCGEGDEDGKDLESKIDDVMVTRSLQVPGQMTHFIASLTLDSAKSCVMQGASCTQIKVSSVPFISSIPFVLSQGSSISPDSFLSSILLLAVMVVIVVVTVIGVVVVDIVGGVPSIIKLSFVIVVTVPSMLWGNPPMKTSIIFSLFGTMFGHKVSNSWNLLA